MPVHATLYLTDYAQGSEDAIKRAVKSIAKQHQSFPLTAQQYVVLLFWLN